MLNKIALKNAKRSMRDYFLYLLTMMVISALMFAFNSMIFSEDILKLCSMAGVMAVFIGLASVFIVFVVAWLIHYMVRFMMEKKSKEFGTYLLLGMKKQEVATLFIKENALVGLLGFVLGILPGIFLQQVFTTIFFSMFGSDYRIKVEFSLQSFCLTLVLYFAVYVVALFRNKRKFKKMTIQKMMKADKENEPVNLKRESFNLVAFFMSIIYFIYFVVMLVTSSFKAETIFIFIVLFIISIYLFYRGLASLIGAYIRSQKSGLYKKDSLFLLRQFSSKIKTMQLTMANLTILFVFSLVGCTISMMFKDYLNKNLDLQLPFDVIVFSDEASDDFEPYLSVIEEEAEIGSTYIYQIYEDGTHVINDFLREELGLVYDETSDADSSEFFEFDTFMKLSDYNNLRQMLGYEVITLSDAGFLVQAKVNTQTLLSRYFEDQTLHVGDQVLFCEGYYTDSFSQSGQNGADYVIVVPDEVDLTPYYSLLAVDLVGDTPDGLQEKLDIVKSYFDESYQFRSSIQWGYGTDQILSFSGVVLVRGNMLEEVKFILIAISFPLIYVGLVFLCVALTILSVQQISDSAKYQYRYDVLRKLGLKEREISWVIFKQLVMYYISPLVISIIIGAVFSLYLSERFIYYTALNSPVFMYFMISVFLLLVVYVIYFMATFVEFKRNVQK